MDYELCKKLKDAGFPFSEHIASIHGEERWGGEELYDESTEVYCNLPNLPELIKACGKYEGEKRFRILELQSEDNWFAGSGDWFDGFGYTFSGRGSTPEEAVANLWLKLNEN